MSQATRNALILMSAGFFAGFLSGVVLVGISLWRIARARTIELATRTQGIDI